VKANRTLEVRPRARRARAIASVAVVAVLGLSACTSDPGPKRVAEDIIKREAILNPELDEACLLAELDRYSSSDLEQIAQDLAAENSERNASGETALRTYELSLSRCL
jgi:uncharacterized lipoprotein